MVMINLVVNGRKVSAPGGSTVLQAAQGAGTKIPTLCDHPALASIGACRMCLVDIKGQRTLQPACTFPITEGMEVQTHSASVMDARRFVLELLLSDHPLDCMTCDSTGSCELQDLMYEYGIKQTRFHHTRRVSLDLHALGDRECAGGLQGALPFHLHEAHPARTD